MSNLLHPCKVVLGPIQVAWLWLLPPIQSQEGVHTDISKFNISISQTKQSSQLTRSQKHKKCSVQFSHFYISPYLSVRIQQNISLCHQAINNGFLTTNFNISNNNNNHFWILGVFFFTFFVPPLKIAWLPLKGSLFQSKSSDLWARNFQQGKLDEDIMFVFGFYGSFSLTDRSMSQFEPRNLWAYNQLRISS